MNRPTPGPEAAPRDVDARAVRVRPLDIAIIWALHHDASHPGLPAALEGALGVATLPPAHRLLPTKTGAWLGWTGPRTALLIAVRGTALPRLERVRTDLGCAGAVVFDLSDSRYGLSLEGRGVSELVGAGCPADLSQAAFPAGSMRSSMLAALPCLVARPTAAPAWWVMVPRSYTAALGAWLRGPWLDIDVVDVPEAASP